MAGRSLQASAEGIQIIRKAIKRDGWKQDELKTELGLSTRQPITRLLKGEPIERPTFEELCHLLGLKVEDVAVLEEVEMLSQTQSINELVQIIREAIRPLVQERCGTMRVLDMTQPIALGSIYTHVNILEKITGRKRLELTKLLHDITPKKFERFSLGAVKEKHIPGLDTVEKYSKLMILGKPGAGKTTFLKHLAIQCIDGEFQSQRVPLFITLKEFAEAEGKPDLLTFMNRWANPPHSVMGANGRSPLQTHDIQPVLNRGRALVLFDGLDEVRETDADRVLHQIRYVSERYARNAFVITCRIAAREYTFEQFTEVEVADFDDAQIADVSGKWFRCKQDEVKAERFLQKLKENPPIQELASSPLLLTLLCLVFEDSGDFPANRAELYQNGVDVLLKKWDSKRNIERDQIYKKLSLKRKEDLLSQIAWQTFTTGNYFFKQKDVERQIREFIENLPGASTDDEALNLDSEAVLKSIEAQHGLFVERARGIYSFSHLTFHEYFAAREAKEKSYLIPLAQHLTDKRWREVILLTVGMLPNADELLWQMKQQVDELLASDEKLQKFLLWADEKARSLNTPYKPTATRALTFTRQVALDYSLNILLNLDFDIPHDLAHDFVIDFALDLDLDSALDLALDLALALDRVRYIALDSAVEKVGKSNLELKLKLENLSAQLSDPQSAYRESKHWLLDQGQAWAEQLRAVMIKYRNIGHDWQFSQEQKEKLQRYYDANQLLVECLNSDCYVSRTVRREIEETLLLAISAIEKYQQQKDE